MEALECKSRHEHESSHAFVVQIIAAQVILYISFSI